MWTKIKEACKLLVIQETEEQILLSRLLTVISTPAFRNDPQTIEHMKQGIERRLSIISKTESK